MERVNLSFIESLTCVPFKYKMYDPYVLYQYVLDNSSEWKSQKGDKQWLQACPAWDNETNSRSLVQVFKADAWLFSIDKTIKQSIKAVF